MNQLVQEIAKQAQYNSLLEKYYLQEVHKTKIAPTEYQRIYNKKFAELIVRECCEVAHCNFHVDGLTLGSILKQHFGVKE